MLNTFGKKYSLNKRRKNRVAQRRRHKRRADRAKLGVAEMLKNGQLKLVYTKPDNNSLNYCLVTKFDSVASFHMYIHLLYTIWKFYPSFTIFYLVKSRNKKPY